jgi:hypothetical protein
VNLLEFKRADFGDSRVLFFNAEWCSGLKNKGRMAAKDAF